jgi:hypothetical protein
MCVNCEKWCSGVGSYGQVQPRQTGKNIDWAIMARLRVVGWVLQKSGAFGGGFRFLGDGRIGEESETRSALE